MKKNGFTLVEVIVAAIITLITAVVIIPTIKMRLRKNPRQPESIIVDEGCE